MRFTSGWDENSSYDVYIGEEKLFKHMKMKSKIGLGFGSLVLIMALVGGAAWWNMRSIAAEVATLQTRHLPESEYFSLVKGQFLDARIAVLHAIQMETGKNRELVGTKLERVQASLGELEKLAVAREGGEDLQGAVRRLQDQVAEYSEDFEALWQGELPADTLTVGLSRARGRGLQIFKEISVIEEQYRREVAVEVEAIAGSAARSSIILLVGVAVALIMALGFSVFLPTLIIRPVREGMVFAEQLAKGDLTSRLSVERKDEMGVLAGSLNRMVDQLSTMLENFLQGVGALVDSSGGLRTVAEDMAVDVKGTVQRTEAVSAASEEMSSNMVSVAAAMEQASSNVNIVASAAEEMSNTIAEIARSADRARRVTGDSVTAAAAASEHFSRLDGAARQIGEVTETISEISAQTNLLALNATIEAARAGESGKGFAVVAGEIKDLARQTAEATAEIARKIRGIQEVTEAAVGRIGDISAVSGEIAKDIAEVSVSSGRVLNNSLQVKKEADDLAGLAERLGTLGKRFRIG